LVALMAALMPLPKAGAEVTLPALFCDNMVLQHGVAVPVWGKADPGEAVAVAMCDQEQKATAGDDGKWLVRLDPLTYGGPFRLTVTGNNRIEINNVLVGEVWVCSGQSNMQWNVANSDNAPQEIADAQYPKIRLFTVQRTSSLTPLQDVQGTWVECSPETVPGFTAVGYFFGRDLHRELNLPIGLINSSWGGTPAEAWTTLEKMDEYEQTKSLVERVRAQIAEHPDLVANWAQYNAEFNKASSEYQKARAEWQKAVERAKQEGTQPPPAPKGPGPVGNHCTPSALYNAMIQPLIPYGIQGAIWYQGEGNAGRAYQYRTLFAAMIECWRENWGQGDFPFLFVQLANFMAVQTDPNNGSAWAELREAQTMTLQLPNTGMAVTIDIGEAENIHPRNKQDVGQRLALWALAKTFNRDIEYLGPAYKAMAVEGNKIRLQLDHVGGGLVARGGPELKGFVIAGEDKKFVWATAEIEGDTVVVSSPEVAAPVAVRYGWADNPVCNLYNEEGLPASPFRTDDWPGVTANKF